MSVIKFGMGIIHWVITKLNRLLSVQIMSMLMASHDVLFCTDVNGGGVIGDVFFCICVAGL